MEAEASGDAPEGVAAGLLADHRKLVKWQVANERAAFALRVLTAAAGIAVAVTLASMIWTASRANGLIVQPFTVSPALAAHGVTGEAVASQLMDRIGDMSEIARAAEPQRRVIGDLGQNISIQIPETGVSLSQLDQWLRDKLGHERRISGEVMTGDDGRLTLVVRSSGSAIPALTGAATELPTLLQKAAEALYAREQPDTYASYLERTGRWVDGEAQARVMITSRSPRERARGYSWLGVFLENTQGLAAAQQAYKRAIALDPDTPLRAYNGLATIQIFFTGDWEAGDRLNARYLDLLTRPGPNDHMTPQARRQRRIDTEFVRAVYHRDYGLALKLANEQSRLDLMGFSETTVPERNVITAKLGLHDIRAARAGFAMLEPRYVVARSFGAMSLPAASEDWAGLLAATEAAMALDANRVDKGAGRFAPLMLQARALNRLGRLAEAEAVLAKTPLDCVPCVIQRGILAELQGNHRLADHWLGEAVRMSPSLPQAPQDWGLVLLARRKPDLAIVQFEAASRLGRQWADPLNGWGEALLAKGDPAGAAQKFQAAAKLAPAWGRTELLWGEALAKQGKTDEARAKWRAAAEMDLTPTERARLQALTGKRTL